MYSLQKMRDILMRQEGGEIYIPACWNAFDVPFKKSDRREGEIIVNEQQFFLTAVNAVLNYAPATPPKSLKNTVIYSMLPRTFAAWDFKQLNKVEGGTLLGCIALLFWLKKMNINCIYLLPVFEMGQEAQKGELSSPYSIKNIMRIDSALHNNLLCGMTSEEEFCAFAQAAHCMGFKIMLDFVFRTCSRDNVLVNEHPDWFYWIKDGCAESLRSPGTDDGKFQIVGHDNIKDLYGGKDMSAFLNYFEYPPNKEEWQNILNEYEGGNLTLSQITSKQLKKVVLTGFADTINDPQPPWTDVTYYKYYFEPCAEVKALVNTEQMPPFIAQDGVKCSIFPAEKPNSELWDYISNVIPYYINTYGLDGARIDMAHALPKELGKSIIEKIRNLKPDFILWSEEFSPERAVLAKAQGYDFILGDSFGCLGIVDEKLIESAKNAALPVTAALETPDTPRIFCSLKQNEQAVRKAVTDMFNLPNSVALINCGQELCELQPMNLGLLNDENGKYVLSPHDPQYGKLAFFDKFMLNWLYNGDMPELIAQLALEKIKGEN